MNQFEKQLEKWNHGTLRGAQAKLARLLKVSTATVALWTTGKRNPSKGYIEQMAHLFELPVEALRDVLNGKESIAYPQTPFARPAHTLRDSFQETTYAPRPHLAAQSNSIAIPLLAAAPSGNTVYEDSDVLEWWTLPRQRAQGAKFLIKLPQSGLIVAIKPGLSAPAFSQILVQKQDGTYQVKDFQGEQNPTVVAQNETGVLAGNKIIGTVVFSVTENKPTIKYWF